MLNSNDIIQMIDRRIKFLDETYKQENGTHDLLKFYKGYIASLKDLKDEIDKAEKKLVNEMAEDYKAEEIKRGIEELNEMSKVLEIRKTLKEEERLYSYGGGIMADFKLRKGEFICPLCGGRHFGNTLCQAGDDMPLETKLSGNCNTKGDE